MAVLRAQEKHSRVERERRQCMKASDRRREAAADTRHTQEVEMHFQQRRSMEVAPEREQRQPGESPRRSLISTMGGGKENVKIQKL